MDGDLDKRDFAQTLARGLACLEALAGMDAPAGCSRIATAMGVSRAAARRILLTLKHLGYVSEERGLYASAPKVLSLGRSMLSRTALWSAAAPAVVRIADHVNEPCSISVLDGLDIVFVCRDATRRIFTSRLETGDRLPAHCSASGKVLLSALPEAEFDRRIGGGDLPRRGSGSITDPRQLRKALAQIRQIGFALAVDEMEDGTLAIAVPLMDRDRRVVAAMSCASHRSRATVDDLRTAILPVLRSAADDVEGIIADYQDRGWIVAAGR
ncbi:IclR family transcriptional regulator C-terminal domain-containing protein [Methylobacterium sp. NEAU 140]|uniref:IclR family transcriptional regulator domain-containing protein n=1 Tax=Methylobacterium sp. NEAU 140 TaxID=3064945 RepID=UPI0027350DC5|nr:IclR family transcriptional regulator C-terminal domain-containing protein [Methylobacterium sp. NEAU 140]MDP4026666.1 IclR family transcriptional regulator C-terminal domain-containing protein [Methylobacterium sp. NEAU 140]